jgi:hypothetical protein
MPARSQSPSQIILSKPIGGGLDGSRAFLNYAYEDVGIPETFQVLGHVGDEGIVNTFYWEPRLKCTQGSRIS